MRFISVVLIAFAVSFLLGCNSYSLRYEAVPQPKGANLYADFHVLQDSVGILIDTDGKRLEDVFIRRSDNTIVRPASIVYPPFGRSASVAPGIGVGVGHVGVGTGVAFPVGPRRAHGLTTVNFQQAAIGPPPWELHLVVHGSPEAVIPGIGGNPTAK